MESGADMFRFLVIARKTPTAVTSADLIIFFIMFETVCTVPFVSIVFLKF